MSGQIDAKMVADWRINYGLDTRTPEQAMRWWSGEMHGCAPAGAVAALGLCIDEIDRLRADLEREQLRLAACGVVALANTPESAAKARQMHDDYRSASCDGVARAVDREMALRAALVAAMEIVHKERVRIAYNAKGAPPSIEIGYADILRRLDAVIAQADAAMGSEG